MNQVQHAFHSIRAEDELKQRTLHALQRAIHSNGKSRRRALPARYGLVAACFVLVASLGLFSHSYATPSGYIGMDINPSVELTVNRFNRVIATRAFNEEGEAVLLALSLRHKEYEQAAILLMDKVSDLGYWQEDGLVSITVQTDDPDMEQAILAAMDSSINSHMQALIE